MVSDNESRTSYDSVNDVSEEDDDKNRDIDNYILDDITIKQWTIVKSRLRSTIGASAFKNWIVPLEFKGIKNNHVVLFAQQKYLRDWVANQYTKCILEFWLLENNHIQNVDIITKIEKNIKTIATQKHNPYAYQKSQEDKLTNKLSFYSHKKPTKTYNKDIDSKKYNHQMIKSHIKEQMSFDNFFVNHTNEMAWRSCKALEDAETHYNPLYIYGKSGVGKTHLLNAVAFHHSQYHPNLKLMILTSDQFMYYFVRALQQKEAIAFKDTLRQADYLLIDDIQFLNNSTNILLEFTHTLNFLLDRNKQIIVTGDRPPHELDNIDMRIRSRLASGLATEIIQPDIALCLEVIHSETNLAQWDMCDEVKDFLARKFNGSIRELRGALNRLITLRRLQNKENLTLEECQQHIKDIISSPEKRITIEDIQRTVSDHFGIRKIEMQSARKSRDVVRPRQIAMYLAKQMTARSLPEIGRKFGGRDHSTVIYGIRRIEEQIAKDKYLNDEVSYIRKIIEE